MYSVGSVQMDETGGCFLYLREKIIYSSMKLSHGPEDIFQLGPVLMCHGFTDYVYFKAFAFVCCLFVRQFVIKEGGLFM